MATSSLASVSSSISNISGYAFLAEALVGGNGDYWGTPEFDVTDASDGGDGGRKLWDDDLADGFDSLQDAFSLQASSSGAVVWGVSAEGDDPIEYAGASCGSIRSVKIRAAVEAPAKTTLSAISVRFYKAGIQTERLDVSSCPTVDRSTASGPVAAEQILTVTASNTDNDAVQVTGFLRFQSASTDTPGDNDMFAQIFVFSA